MKGNKIIATLVVLTMLLSTLVVLNQLNIVNKASAQPGVDEWGHATSELVYGVSYEKNTIEINTTGWSTGIHYLYYPTYKCGTGAGRPATAFSWDGPYEVSGDQVYVNATDAGDDLLYTYNQMVTFNRSGMWIFDNDEDHSSYGGYLWVNTWTAYTIASINDFAFGSTDDVSIEVKEGDVLANCRIALIDPEGTTILNSATGADVVTVDASDFTMAGDYTVRAYRDLDEIDAAYYYLDEAGDAPYDELYGSGAFFAGIYDYSEVGPWDPPEKNATEKTFTVTTAKPSMILTNTTLYWGYAANIDINITGPDGTGIDASTDNLVLQAPNGAYYTEGDFVDFSFLSYGAGNYTIALPQWQLGINEADWNLLTNGTWYVIFGLDQSGDSIEEWNSSIGLMNRFVVKSSSEPVNNPPVLGTPSHMNGSTGNSLSFNWGIPINDPEGDIFSWNIQCNNGQNNNNISAANGTKSLSLSGLKYSTTYKIWVNATDPTGSGNYTRKWFTFTTKSSGDGGGGEEPPVVTENKKPIADASAGEPYQEFVNSEITFDGSKSYDPDGNITKWFWVFGDNTNGNGKIIRHSYSKAGTYNVSLTVTDNQGATNTDTTKCMISQVNNRPPTKPFITGPINGTKNTLYTYTAVSTDADNNTLQYTFDWGDLISTPQLSGFLPNGSGFTQNHSWKTAGRYDVMVTVTDNQTESSSNIIVYIDAVQAGQAGYLLDNNGDGTYDGFYSNELKQITTVEKKDDGYLIDSDGDGDTEYKYNNDQGLTAYTEPEKTPGFELIIVIGAIALVFLWKRKRIAYD